MNLYGQAISREHPSGLSAQIYNVLRQEILRKRWERGEKIPSYKDLMGQTGISQRPIQNALSRLEDEGYIKRIRHKGIFVESTVSPSNQALGRVLVAVPSPEDHQNPGFDRLSIETQGFGRINISRLVKEAQKLGLEVKVCPVPAAAEGDPDWEPDVAIANERTLFGVISLLEPDRVPWLHAAAESCSVIYLGTDETYATPCLTGMPFLAASHTTQHLLELNHRRIAILPDPHLHERCDLLARRGVAAALRRAGQDSLQDLVVLDKPEAAVPEGVTGLVCFSIDLARRVVSFQESQGRRVPEDLSVVSLQTGSVQGGTRLISGVYYDWTQILSMSFDILLAPERFKKQSLACMKFAPFLQERNTTAAPAG